MFTRIVSVFLLWISYIVSGSVRDETEVFACHDEFVEIQCRRRESTIAIYAATFAVINGATGAQHQHCDRRKPPTTQYQNSNDTCVDDVRLVVNKRCSGMSECKFLVAELVPRECYGAGVFTLTYGCASVSDIVKYCNVNIEGNTAEGFIQNPGYPNYYPGVNKCSWTIRGDTGQTILLSVLDMSLQPNSGVSAVDCRDSIQIFDGSLKLMHACGWDLAYLFTFQSSSNNIRVVFTSRDVWPSRGIRLYYRVLGCATLPAPLHGYLVYRNVSMAHYMCCARHAFVDDYKRNRILICEDGNKWNGTVSSCKHIKVLREWRNGSEAEFEDDGFAENDPIRQDALPHINFVYDVLIPSVIMATMIISNVLIVLIILRLRRRAKQREEMLKNVSRDTRFEQPSPSTSKHRNGNGYHENGYGERSFPTETGV